MKGVKKEKKWGLEMENKVGLKREKMKIREGERDEGKEYEVDERKDEGEGEEEKGDDDEEEVKEEKSRSKAHGEATSLCQKVVQEPTDDPSRPIPDGSIDRSILSSFNNHMATAIYKKGSVKQART
ncbi:hypothetical protein Syun_023349 [Stephania yunnanensis]|uniref:Uncharacterized protein n=1 Tax=Stephania yunnanensis TaxID=152371 RepID=A0AAP0HZI4_9MAGN